MGDKHTRKRTLRTASIGAIALTLTRQHGFDPDVACYVRVKIGAWAVEGVKHEG